MTQVIFSAANFKIRYPEFVGVSDPRLQLYFDEACLYLSNADNSPVQSIARRTILLDMLTAHVAKLGGAIGGGVAPVGRTSSASEGSVSASFDYQGQPSAAWYNQTPYGASFWQATSALRGMRYIARPTIY